ncbi:MAG: RNA pseudouridine synthase [Bacteroidales bacterium]|nr:RNA pseudouridine synthase [Bacteroidales bacterium]
MPATFSERILFEDNHLLIVNKYAGELVQGDKTGDIPLVDKVKQYLKVRYSKPGNVFAGLVHRIDRPVSGLVVFAKTGKALTRMNAMVQQRDFKKYYYAIVRNKPAQPQGLLEHYLKKNETQNKSYVADQEDKAAKKALLTYSLVASSDSFHLIEIELLTGRHHQIRAQLAALGSPIAGDLKYGDKRSLDYPAIALHAFGLEFIHPVKKIPLQFRQPMPEHKPWIYFDTDK